MRARVLVVCFLALANVGGERARADIIYSSLDQSTSFQFYLAGSAVAADSFSTGASATTLSDVKLFLIQTEPAGALPPVPQGVTVALYSDSSGSPGTQLLSLGSIADSNVSTTAAKYDFSSFSPYTLSASTRYWIEASGSASTLIAWEFASTASGTGVSGEYNYHESSSYANSSTNPPLQMTVTATPSSVPEPGPLVFLGVAGLLGAASSIRRRRSAARAS